MLYIYRVDSERALFILYMSNDELLGEMWRPILSNSQQQSNPRSFLYMYSSLVLAMYEHGCWPRPPSRSSSPCICPLYRFIRPNASPIRQDSQRGFSRSQDIYFSYVVLKM
jgi:hypothetical protein